MDGYTGKQGNRTNNVPLWVTLGYNLFKDLSGNKKTKMAISLINFIWIFVIPVYYYWDTLFSNY